MISQEELNSIDSRRRVQFYYFIRGYGCNEEFMVWLESNSSAQELLDKIVRRIGDNFNV